MLSVALAVSYRQPMVNKTVLLEAVKTEHGELKFVDISLFA